MLCHQCLIAVCPREVSAPLNKRRKKVTLAIRILFLDKRRQGRRHIAAAHIRWIRHHDVILRREPRCLSDQRQNPLIDLVHPRAKEEVPCLLFGVLDEVHERVIAFRLHGQQGAVFLGVLECLDEIIHHADEVVLEGELPDGEAVPRRLCPRRKSVALLDRHHVRLDPPAEEAAVILPRLHHHGKIRKLRRTLVDVEAVEVVLHDGRCGVARRISIVLVDPHQHVEHIAEDMSAAHAGVDAANVLRPPVCIFFSHRGQLCSDGLLLLCFGEVVCPCALQGVARMSLEPQAAEGVLDHVAHDPVGGEELRCGGDFLLCDLDVFLERGEDFVLRLGVVVLV